MSTLVQKLPLEVFVSSTCFDLETARDKIKDALEEMGATAYLSNRAGFPHVNPEYQPHVDCLTVLERSHAVIGILGERYGQPQQDWSPYNQYSGLAPTHAEFLHTLSLNKRFFVFVNKKVAIASSKLRRGDAQEVENLGVDRKCVEIYDTMQNSNPKPWIFHYETEDKITEEVKASFHNELVKAFEDIQKHGANLRKISEEFPEIDGEILGLVKGKESLELVRKLESATRQLDDLNEKILSISDKSSQAITDLNKQKQEMEKEIQLREIAISEQRGRLALAAIKDASWLYFIRRTMVQPLEKAKRVPFHHAGEIQLRGYNTSPKRMNPTLEKVYWSRLAYNEGGLHRGYSGGLILLGKGFLPGITVRFSHDQSNGSQPNIFWGDYLEISTTDDDVENNISWMKVKFRVCNPEGETSEWIDFSSNLKKEEIKNILDQQILLGEQAAGKGDLDTAWEAYRKASVYAGAIEDPRSSQLAQLREQTLDNSLRAKLRFSEGRMVRVTDGPHKGKVGKIKEINLRWRDSYVLDVESVSELVAVQDKDLALV